MSMEVYAEMLLDELKIDIGIFKKKPELIPQPYIITCCGPIELNEVEGHYSCIECGLIKDGYYIVNEEEPQRYTAGMPVGSRSSYTYSKYRPYKPLTHFREHLRRYAGQRFVTFPKDLINDLKTVIDPLDRKAFSKVKHYLKKFSGKRYTVKYYDKEMRVWREKQCKPTKFYKDIFSIIYELGGLQPNVKNINEMFAMYSAVCFQFKHLKGQGATNRRNMPSHYMLLDLLLKEYGNEPYYEIPYLKDEELRNSVLKIFNVLRNNVQKVMGEFKV
jgi:hypothetical protein